MMNSAVSGPTLAATITRAASKQTYYTIRYLVDSGLVEDAFRAYAYFRWVDDWLDQEARPQTNRLAFVQRQQTLMEACFSGNPPSDPSPEENLLVVLIEHDQEKNTGLEAYVRNMMAVMSFDADRRGGLVSRVELNRYTHWLAVGVTEAMHYFIGHRCASPSDATRYAAVTGAHLVHLLRDALDDAEAGYYNIPSEVVVPSGISPADVASRPYLAWVKENVRKARACFRIGRDYLARVENLRCRIAGYAYIRRFETVLDCIEREGYLLRAAYPERKGPDQTAKTIAWALWMAFRHRQAPFVPSGLPIR